MASVCCLICLANTKEVFYPYFRPKTCKCKYTVHERCYDMWLQQTNMAYNCIICHISVPHKIEPLDDEDELPRTPDKWSMCGKITFGLTVVVFLFGRIISH